jgi:hypothetical protein
MRLWLRAHYLTLEEHRAAFVEAGFTEVEVHKYALKGWMCAVGTRP